MRLSNAQIRFFRDVGYLQVGTIVPEAQVEKMRAVVLDHIENRIEPFRANESGDITYLDNIIERDQVFLDVCTSAHLLRPLESLLGPNIELTLNRHNHATINRRGQNPVRLHRDVLQWSRPIITAVIYLENATIDNGCTKLIPRSHFLPFVGTPNNGGTWMDEHHVFDDLLAQAVDVPMPKGGILLFDSLVFHTVGLNYSDSTRMSVTFGIHSVDELAGCEDPKKLLILGKRIYKGNDRNRQSIDS
ncbi:hypothetical protein E3V36_05530 [Candidatus Marinimicrobia bacterium MT.SAG.2]|nr:hypothetical protein E3V36_05530 [Candidatus Marinimicrobia bacterium MT.SAG.2]